MTMTATLEVLLLVLAVFGGIDLAGRGIGTVSRAFPPLLSARAKGWKLLSDIITVRSFQRRAISSRLEEVVNQTAFYLQKNLPKGWARRARINWVRRPQPAYLREGEILLRVRPAADHDHTLMNALWIYFRSILFPENRDIVPENIMFSASLAITRAGLAESHPYLIPQFDSQFMAYAAQASQNQIDFYADCTRLNEFGLLMGPFVREVDYAATTARFRGQRDLIVSEIRGIADHMLAFQPLMNVNKPADQWIHTGQIGSYAFLLISRPPATRPDIQAYVSRAEEHFSNGALRLYVIGRLREREFVLKVVEAILNLRQLKGIEMFPLFRDYRGDPGGIGFLVGLDPILSGLKLTPRPLAVTPPDTLLPGQNGELAIGDPPKEISDREKILMEVIDDIGVRLSDYEGAWINLAEFGGELRRQILDFTPGNYGERNLVSVLKNIPQLELDESGKALGTVRVRLRTGYSTGFEDKARKLEEAGARIAEILDRYSPGSWIFLGQVGALIKREFSDFDYKQLGFASLHEFINAVSCLEMDERGEGYSKTYVRVR